MSLFVRKPLDQVLAQAADNEKGLKRTLGAGNLIALGIGAIIGAGLFVRTAAAAGQAAGPAVTISFIIAAIGCAFAGLCYAEFASMIPIAVKEPVRARTRLKHLLTSAGHADDAALIGPIAPELERAAAIPALAAA